MNMTVRSTANLRYGPGRLVVVLLAVFWIVSPAVAQKSDVMGSVPSGPARNEVLRLTLRDALDMALRYNLEAIESGENAQIARGQRLLALSHLLPQVGAGINENVDQVNFTALGLAAIKIPGIPAVAGPFSYSTASASLSQTQLSYKDTLDVITLSVGNAYLEVIEAHSRIEAEEAQVQNAKALYDQAVDEFQAGTSPRIDETRTAVQLHTEEYNLSVA